MTWRIAAVAVIAAGIGAAAAFARPADAPPSRATVTVQGERLHGGRVVRAGGRRALLLTSGRSARGRVALPRASHVTVVARGASCAGAAARIALAVGGRTVVAARVPGARRWTTLAGAATVAAGTRSLALRLVNPGRTRHCRRAAWVDRIVFGRGPASPSPAPSRRWRPAPGTTWQWQLTGTLDFSVRADMYDIDLFDRSAADVAKLHARGRRVVCYLDAGTYEPGRPDAGDYPEDVLGAGVEGWPGERWLDIRRLDVLGPVIERRLDRCRAKGFDGVEPDNVDAYNNESGFPLTAADQLAFNRFVAAAAHARGLSVGLKNDLEQAATLEPDFDWALSEQCFQYGECERLAPFVAAGKAAFVAEYERAPSSFCAQARAAGLSAIRKHLDLDAWRDAC